MPIYAYRCLKHGVFEKRLRMTDASAKYPCPSCGQRSDRSYSVPMVTKLTQGTRSAIDTTETSREHPAVVHDVPPSTRNTPSITANPKHYKLPRP